MKLANCKYKFLKLFTIYSHIREERGAWRDAYWWWLRRAAGIRRRKGLEDARDWRHVQSSV